MYQNALDAPFVFDDRDTILLNPSLVSAWDLRAVLFHNVARPAVNVSYAVDRALWGLTSFGFHVTGVILHIAVVALFYGICTRALADEATQTSRAGLTPEWGAFFAAAILAVHPVMSGAVVYVSARSELLCAIGFLGCLTYARRAILVSSRTAAAMAAVLGALAVGSSSSAAALPLIVMAYDGWVLRKPGWRRRALRLYVPATVAMAAAVAARLPVMLSLDRVPPRGLADNLLTEAVVIWRYAGLLLFPHPQALVHDVRSVQGLTDPLALLAIAAIAGVVVAVMRIRRSRPLLAFGVVWFLAVLAPTTSVIPVRDAMAEHRLYLASGGLLLAGASMLSAALGTRRSVRIAATVALVLLAARTFDRNRLWADPIGLWEEAVERSPGAWQAHLGYAELLRDLHRCDRAAPEYLEVLRLYRDHPAAGSGLQECR